MKKWLKYLGFAFLAFIAIGIIAVATDSKSEATETGSVDSKVTSPKDIPFTVADKDVSPRQITYRIVIDERADKAALIEIARKLKSETGWKDELVCFFNIKVYSSAGAWASVAYLPRCSECETDKDKDGAPVEFRLIGVTASLADSLQQLRLDTIENKQLIASYIDDAFRCKVELYSINNNPSRLLMAQLFTTGRYLQWRKLVVKGGENRYYPDDEDDAVNYQVIDDKAKLIHFKNGEGKTEHSVATTSQ
jgi:hypothetical protein